MHQSVSIIILGSRKRQRLLPPQEIISISSCQIERVQSYFNLGVIVNQCISWSEHIQHLCLKVRKLIGMLYRQIYTWANNLTLRTVNMTCIRPHFCFHATRKILKLSSLLKNLPATSSMDTCISHRNFHFSAAFLPNLTSADLAPGQTIIRHLTFQV